MECKSCIYKKRTCSKCTQAHRKANKLCLTCGDPVLKGLLCETHRIAHNEKGKRIYDPAKKNKYYQENKDHILKTHATYVKKKYKTDVQFRLRRNILSRIQEIMKSSNGKKMYSISKNMGCTYEELKQHLEESFEQHPETGEYMNWENYGVNGWHIDHIIPLAAFNLNDPLHFQLANHYSNLQPIWSEHNIKKSDSMDESYLHTISLEDGIYIIEEPED